MEKSQAVEPGLTAQNILTDCFVKKTQDLEDN